MTTPPPPTGDPLPRPQPAASPPPPRPASTPLPPPASASSPAAPSGEPLLVPDALAQPATMTMPPPPSPYGLSGDYPPMGSTKRKRPRRQVGQVTVVAMGAMLGAAVLGNLALRTELTSVASALAFAGLVVALWLSGAVETPRAKVLGGLVLLVAMWLPVRASEWLFALNTVTAMALIGAIVLFGNAPLPRLISAEIMNFFDRLFGGFLAPRLLAGSVPSRQHSQLVFSALRGVALASIPVLTLAALLASADAVFASAVTPRWNLGSLASHVFLTAVLIALALSLVCIHRMPAHRDDQEPVRPIGAIEALVVVGSVGLLFSAFAVTQLVTALGGADHILDAQSLTRAEYARTGFFQLLGVASLTLGLLGVIAVATKTDGALARIRRVANAAVSLLTVVIVVVSIIRLRLYTDAFGQTTLRWYCTAFAAMLGIIFVLLAIRHLMPQQLPWFGRAALAVVVTTLFVVNVANPEARVAEHNLSRSNSVVALDGNYLIRLSADAWPAILQHEDRVIASLQQGRWTSKEALFDNRCVGASKAHGYGPLGFNSARAAVDCPR